MVKFDGIRMQYYGYVKYHYQEGCMNLVFNDNRFLKIKVVDGKLVSESIPE